MSAVQTRLSELLIAQFGVTENDITPEATFDEMALDSLALIEFTMVIKKDMGVLLDDDALQPTSTIADAAALIEAKGVRV
jgi:acyl carrier protein